MRPTLSGTSPGPRPPEGGLAPAAPEPTIGLALSGGGSRAIAFHLGCLRALNDLGILPRVKILSTVSGGSVIGALYTAFDEPFPEFEKRVRRTLERGLTMPTARTAFTTLEGLKALVCFLLVGSAGLVFFSASWLIWLVSLLAAPEDRKKWQPEPWRLPLRRFASRTTIFRRAVDDALFQGAALRTKGNGKPFLIINAAELRTGLAFYFTAGGLRVVAPRPACKDRSHLCRRGDRLSCLSAAVACP